MKLSSIKNFIVKFSVNFLSIFVLFFSLSLLFEKDVHYYWINLIVGLILLLMFFFTNTFFKSKIEQFITIPKIQSKYIVGIFVICLIGLTWNIEDTKKRNEEKKIVEAENIEKNKKDSFKQNKLEIINHLNELKSQNNFTLFFKEIEDYSKYGDKELKELKVVGKKEYFEKNKEEVINKLNQIRNTNNFNLFFKEIDPYLQYEDKDIQELNGLVKKQYGENRTNDLITIINQLENKEDNFKFFIKHYKELVELNPNNQNFKYELDKYVSKVEAITKKEARNELILKQFTPPGFHTVLYSVVKTNMKDPISFEHISTKYEDKGDYIIVEMRFRGKNSFGANTINNVIGKFKLSGEVISIKY